jgi:hypothetical protein
MRAPSTRKPLSPKLFIDRVPHSPPFPIFQSLTAGIRPTSINSSPLPAPTPRAHKPSHPSPPPFTLRANKYQPSLAQVRPQAETAFGRSTHESLSPSAYSDKMSASHFAPPLCLCVSEPRALPEPCGCMSRGPASFFATQPPWGSVGNCTTSDARSAPRGESALVKAGHRGGKTVRRRQHAQGMGSDACATSFGCRASERVN